MLNRRRFIGVVGLGGVAVALGGLRFLEANSPLVKELDLKHISKRHATLMASLFKSVLALETDQQIQTMILRADTILSKFDRQSRFELMGGLEILEQSPLWQIGSITRFSKLDPSNQILVLKKWSSGIKAGRALSQGLKEFSVFVFYSQDSSWQEIGYEGPLVRR